MTSRVLAILMSLSVASAVNAQFEPAECTAGSCLQIGSLNIEYLGKDRSDYRGQDRPRRTGPELEEISELLTSTLDLEVIVLQEINTQSTEWSELRSKLEAKGFDFFEGTTSNREQFIVLAWDSDEVEVVASARELSIPDAYADPQRPSCAYSGLRIPSAVHLRAGEFDFWLVGVHLKSRTPVGGLSDCDDWIRKQQAADLVSELNRLRDTTGEDDFVVVGDFNHSSGHTSLRPFRTAGFTSQMNYLLGGAGDTTYLKSSGDVIDHIMLRYPKTQELVPSSGFIFTPSDVLTYILKTSDHAPVFASFRTGTQPTVPTPVGTSLDSAADRRRDKSHLVVMTLNAEFLWDGIEPEDGNDQIDFPWKGSQTEAAEHMAEIAEAIVKADADIVNLVEVEGLRALERLNVDFLGGRGYRAALIDGKDNATGQDVGLLTRIDLVSGPRRDERKGRSGNVSKGVSKHYIAELNVDDLKLGLIGIHLLARPNSESRRRPREAQAAAISRMARDLVAQGRQVIVWGDFNDYDGNVLDHVDSAPISDVLVWIKDMDHANPDDDLVNVAQFVPKAMRFTSHWDQDDDDHVDEPHELTSIDHILVSPTLIERIESVEFPHDYNPVEVSDHYPIVVRFRTGGTEDFGGAFVRLTELLPNPEGDDDENETATLKNLGTQAVSLTGWSLRDRAGAEWDLSGLGTLAPGVTAVIRRAGQSMALNNDGDTIELIDGQGLVLQTVVYAEASWNEPILVPEEHLEHHPPH